MLSCWFLLLSIHSPWCRCLNIKRFSFFVNCIYLFVCVCVLAVVKKIRKTFVAPCVCVRLPHLFVFSSPASCLVRSFLESSISLISLNVIKHHRYLLLNTAANSPLAYFNHWVYKSA